jgi:hypothetical protein
MDPGRNDTQTTEFLEPSARRIVHLTLLDTAFPAGLEGTCARKTDPSIIILSVPAAKPEGITDLEINKRRANQLAVFA